jgi:tripartite-type tricarboxylate transporter receptor subunit TctC
MRRQDSKPEENEPKRYRVRALAIACASSACAREFPSQRIALVADFSAGGFADSIARITGDRNARHASGRRGDRAK